MLSSQIVRSFVMSAGILALGVASSVAQNASSEPGAVVIRREPLRLIAPDAYRLPLQLEPAKQLMVAAPCDGTVLSVDAELGKVLPEQAVLIRLEPRERQLMLDRAITHLKLADLELEQAKKSGQGMELAEARRQAAQADVKLLQWQVEQLTQRAPFTGTVLKVHVQVGQFVKAGTPLLSLADLKELQIEIPVDRSSTKEADTVRLRVEDQTLEARVGVLRPAEPKFERLRDLSTSLATTTVKLDNATGKWHVGQAVFAPLVPRYPTAEVANSAVGVNGDGRRKVQVVRQGVVRDVEVNLLGQVGAERVFVTGPFSEGDALILSASRELADGTQVRPNPNAALPPASVPSPAPTTAGVKTLDKPAAEKKKAAAGF